MKVLDILTMVLLIIGGLNWLLVGLFDFNLVTFIFNQVPIMQKAIYVLVGIAAVYQICQYPWKI